jgi:DHA1 family multidrug resistance protein-like MFS transporter
LILVFAQSPWHIVLAFLFQGLFSGFSPAAIALTSVSVPDSQISRSLGIVNGAQYLGSTVGPAIGAGLAILAGFRGAIIVAAAMPAIAAIVVMRSGRWRGPRPPRGSPRSVPRSDRSGER